MQPAHSFIAPTAMSKAILVANGKAAGERHRPGWCRLSKRSLVRRQPGPLGPKRNRKGPRPAQRRSGHRQRLWIACGRAQTRPAAVKAVFWLLSSWFWPLPCPWLAFMVQQCNSRRPLPAVDSLASFLHRPSRISQSTTPALATRPRSVQGTAPPEQIARSDCVPRRHSTTVPWSTVPPSFQF